MSTTQPVIFDYDTALEFKVSRYVYAINELLTVKVGASTDTIWINACEFPDGLQFDKDFFITNLVPMYSENWDIVSKGTKNKEFAFTKKASAPTPSPDPMPLGRGF